MREVLLIIGFMTSLVSQASCYSYVHLGTLPPENPDYTVPIQARVTLKSDMPVPPGSVTVRQGSKLSGMVKEWNEGFLVFLLESCDTDPRCTFEIPLDKVSSVEARKSTVHFETHSDWTAESTIALLVSGVAVGFAGWFMYYSIYEKNLWMWP